MRKLAEKIIIVAQICITLVFAVTTLINLSNVFYDEGSAYNTANIQNNGVLASLMAVLFIVYLGLSAYLIYVNFSESENLKRLLLFCDSESATRTTVKVIRKTVTDCSKQTEGVKVKKIRVRADDKHGFALHVKVAVSADSVAQVIDKFRCMLRDAFKNTLGITFNSINFEVAKLNTRYIPTVDAAEEQPEQLEQQREVTDEIYNEPLDNDINLDGAVKEKNGDSSRESSSG